MVRWGLSYDPDHLEIGFSNIRGYKLSLVKGNRACLVPKCMREVPPGAQNGNEKLKKNQKKWENPGNPPEGPYFSFKGP